MFNEDTLFLSSSAEYNKAESAPCCAKLSLERAMSDNSNSTGSSGSSTNSWTLLSPEVRHRTRPGNLCFKLFSVPEYNLEDASLLSHEYKFIWREMWHVCTCSPKPPIMIKLCQMYQMMIKYWYLYFKCVMHWLVYFCVFCFVFLCASICTWLYFSGETSMHLLKYCT